MDYVVDWVKLQRDGLLVVTLSGPGDSTALKALMDELEAATLLGPIPILLDESSFTAGRISTLDLRHMAEWWRETQRLGGSQVAVIAPREVVFGLNRMFLLVAGIGGDGRLSVFRSRSEALDWLGERRIGALSSNKD